MKNNEYCANCKYFLNSPGLDEGCGNCQRFPPVYVGPYQKTELNASAEGYEDSNKWAQPTVSEELWCGEFMEK